METQEKVKQWEQEGGDFVTGLQLLRELGGRHLANNLQRLNNALAREKLAIELYKRANLQRLQVQPVQQIVNNVAEVSETITDPLELLLAEKAEIYNRETSLRNQMYKYEDPEHSELRQRLVSEILALNNRRAEIEQQVEYYTKHGKLPPQPTAEPELAELSDIELQKRIGNVRSYITKCKNTLETEKDEKKRSRAEANLIRYQKELEQLEQLINQRLKK